MTLQLHYRGNHTPFDGSQILGPDRDHALYSATAATYNPERDMTTVTVRPLTLEEKHTWVQQRLAEQRRLLLHPLVGSKD